MDDKQQTLPMPDSQDLAAPPAEKPAQSRAEESRKRCPVHGSIGIPDCPYCEARNN